MVRVMALVLRVPHTIISVSEMFSSAALTKND
jgi:hypothetical protein